MASKGYSTDWTQTKATDAALRKFRGTFAKRTGVELRSSTTHAKVPVIPSGSIALDLALKAGGWPRGRLVQAHGPETAGKTSLACLAIAEAQRAYPDQAVGWVDPEKTFDLDWAATLGVDTDPDRLLTPEEQPSTAEDAADYTRLLLESGLCSIVVFDSVGALVSKAELEKTAEESTVAVVARIMTRLSNAYLSIGAKNGTTFFVINQQRAQVNANGGRGPAVALTGGNALRHATSVRVRVGRGGETPKMVKFPGEDAPVVVGYEMAIKVEKNKVGPAGSAASLWLFNRHSKFGPPGVDLAFEARHLGTRYGVIGQAGGWYTVPDGSRFHGEAELVNYLRLHPTLVTDIRAKALESVAHEVGDQGEDVEDEETEAAAK